MGGLETETTVEWVAHAPTLWSVWSCLDALSRACVDLIRPGIPPCTLDVRGLVGGEEAATPDMLVLGAI